MKRAILPPSLMVTSIIGFIISAVYMFSGSLDRWFAGWGPNVGTSLGFAFCCAFAIMFVASMVSMTPTDNEMREE